MTKLGNGFSKSKSQRSGRRTNLDHTFCEQIFNLAPEKFAKMQKAIFRWKKFIVEEEKISAPLTLKVIWGCILRVCIGRLICFVHRRVFVYTVPSETMTTFIVIWKLWIFYSCSQMDGSRKVFIVDERHWKYEISFNVRILSLCPAMRHRSCTLSMWIHQDHERDRKNSDASLFLMISTMDKNISLYWLRKRFGTR